MIRFDSDEKAGIYEMNLIVKLGVKEWEEVRGRECRRKEEVPEDQYKGQRYISNLILKCHNSPPPPHNQTILYQRRRVGGRDRWR